ncbi:MAG TPA: dihydrofolate reductase [Alcaligenaceae bacterium]|nr:dihydrofolate reductase [Alcaligenaceae bacterium]
MQLNLIVAYARNRTIGRNNTLPWKLSGDLAHFKRTTTGCPIIMGRKTWDSLGRPLPGRRNIVITRDPDLSHDGAEFVSSLQSALELVRDAEQAFVIGGAQIYREALPIADCVIATEIQAEVEGDAFFAELDPGVWIERSRAPQPPENGLPYDIVVYQRGKSQSVNTNTD